ncbi:MAG: outer membrane lipoprotein-sorting protein [Bradymonadia bacterium]
MRKTIVVLALGALFGNAWSETTDPAAKGLAIAKAADQFNAGFLGESSNMEMVLINAHGDTMTRKMESRVLEGSDDGDKSIITFIWPADVKGTRMLTWSHKVGRDDQWLYLPTLKRVKRISSRNKSGAFMGSEFAYEDLGSQEVEKYTHKWLKDEVVSGRAHQILERIPVDKKSGYSKQIVWLDREYQQATKIDYFDRKGELLKTFTFGGYAQFGKFWRPATIEAVNHQTRKKSRLTWNDRKVGAKQDSTQFTKDSLTDW